MRNSASIKREQDALKKEQSQAKTALRQGSVTAAAVVMEWKSSLRFGSIPVTLLKSLHLAGSCFILNSIKFLFASSSLCEGLFQAAVLALLP